MTKSNATKAAQGTLRKERVKITPNYDILDSVPAPSFQLNEHGQSYFVNFCELLISNKTMTAAFIPIITRAARYYEIYQYANEKVKEQGAVQETNTGYTAKNGYFVTMTDAEDRINKIEALFGMNLYNLQKLNIPEPPKKDDLAELLSE